MSEFGDCNFAITAGITACLPSTWPLLTNAITQRDRSLTLEKIDPAGHDAVLFAAGRTTFNRPSSRS